MQNKAPQAYGTLVVHDFFDITLMENIRIIFNKCASNNINKNDKYSRITLTKFLFNTSATISVISVIKFLPPNK